MTKFSNSKKKIGKFISPILWIALQAELTENSIFLLNVQIILSSSEILDQNNLSIALKP